MDTGLDSLKTASKMIVYKEAEATGEFLGNEIVDKFVKPLKEIIIPPEKKEEILNKLRQVL